MSIVEKIKEILETFPKISEVCNSINVDFSSNDIMSYGLTSIGDGLVIEDVLGNQRRTHSFMLYATYSGVNDYERINNQNALTELSVWLTHQVGGEVTTEVDGKECGGFIQKITAGNAMLYALPENSPLGTMRYQLQITAEYTVEF